MDRIDCLSAFVHVFESGSFSAAARRMGTTQPTISKRIASLEEEFETNLFFRSTRQLMPTEEASRIYETARAILEMYDQAQASTRGVTTQAAGTLCISIPSSLGRSLLMPIVGNFMRLHPNLSLDIRFSEHRVNLIEEGVELALRIGDMTDSSLRARALGRVPRFAVASPVYLERHPAHETVEDLQSHHCIGYSRFGDVSQWVFESELGRHVAKIDCSINMDDADGMLSAVLEGLGIAILPGWLVTPHLATGQLRIVLPENTVPSLPLHAVYPEVGQLSIRARRFLDYLAEQRGMLDTASR